jgi:hypothetical protein
MIRSNLPWAFRCGAVALALAPAAASAQIDVEAYSGEPFGVARVTLVSDASIDDLKVGDAEGRVLYPAPESRPLRKTVRSILGLNRPRPVSYYLLFRGKEPFQIDLAGLADERLNVVPVRNSAGHGALLDEWWRAYRAPTRIWNQTDDYPPQVENYLSTMLARRLDLPIGERRLGLLETDTLGSILGPLVGTEDARIQLQRDLMLEIVEPAGSATLPLPPYAPPEMVLAEPDEEVEVEPIARHVPAECFYVRFGSFTNFQWLTATLERAGGDLGAMISVRGLNNNLRGRIERRLAQRETELSRALGEVVIDDVALVGSDAFFREGASFGLLFQAGDAAGLIAGLNQQRREVLASEPDATETEVEIAGRKVSLLATPDNRVRSYLAVDGDFHFITTSATLVRRFFEAGSGDRNLAGAIDFRRARRMISVRRRDTLFAYLSDAFLRHIASPQNRIEMSRRMQAGAEIELVELARLAARAEGRPADTITDLVAAGLLPRRFGPRADGSETRLEEGVVFDTFRGRRGGFIPAADVEVTAASPQEVEEYERFAEFAGQQWERIEPAAIAVKRRLRDGGWERITFEAHLTPAVAQGNNILLSLLGRIVGQGLGTLGGPGGPAGGADSLGMVLGPPDRLRLAPVPGDLVAAEVVLGEHHLFAGLRDVQVRQGGSPLTDLIPRGLLDNPLLGLLAQSPQDYLVGYLGATPAAGGLAFLDRPDFGLPDPQGYSYSRGPLVRRHAGGMVVYSYHPAILEEVTPQLRFEQARRPAQARLRVADLTGTALEEKIDLFSYGRARRTSAGNAAFLDSLAEQLHVPADECLHVAETILDAQLKCPLGGEYVLAADGASSSRWVSTAWRDDAGQRPAAAPPDYRAPALNWFRGLDAELLLINGKLALYGSIETQLPERPAGPQPELVPLPEGEDVAPADEAVPEVEVYIPPEATEVQPPKELP